MKVLGISGGRGGAAAAVIQDGRVVAAAAEERFTRQRCDPNFPRFAIEFCLAELGVEAHELDAIVWHERPQSHFTRVLTATLGGFPGSLPLFIREMKDWMGEGLWVRNRISRELDVHPDLVHFVPGHRARMAHAFVASQLDEAAVLLADGVSEWVCSGLGHARYDADGRLELEECEVFSYPHSLGLVLAAFAAYLGLRPTESLADVGHIAAYGKPVYAGRVSRMVAADGDGYAVSAGFFRFAALSSGGLPFTRRLTDLLGPARDYRRPMPFGTPSPVGPEDQRFADVAASVLEVIGERLVGLARRLHGLTNATDCCLTGELARVRALVDRVRREGPFARVHVPLEPSAAGGAIGAAVLHSGRAALSPYLGQSYDETRDMAAMRGADPTWWQRYRRRGCRSVRGSEIRVEHAESVTALLPQVAQELAAGRIVGWLQGPFAWGDRPLGGRSVLADPATSGIEARLREGVTGAPAFRPLPRVRYGDFAPLDPLLECFQRITGRNELLEVGLAEEGYPLAASPADALLIFMRTEMDILAINRMLVRKVDR